MKNALANLIGSVTAAENLLAHYSPEEVRIAMGHCDNEMFRRQVPTELAPYVFVQCMEDGATFADRAEEIIARCAKMRRMAFEKRVRHHTVPKFYLENFATDPSLDSQRLLHTYRMGQYIGKVGLDNSCVRKHFYSFKSDSGIDNSAEVGLSLIESVGAEVIAKIIVGDRLTEQEHYSMCYFIAVTWARTPQYREKARRRLRESAAETLRCVFENEDQIAKDLEDYNRINSSALTLAEIKESLQQGHTKVEPNDAMILAATISRAEDLVPLIDATKWLVLDAAKGSQFVTSDSPVVLHSAIRPPTGHYVGWATPQLEATFPLSDRVCMLMTHDYRGERICVDAATVDELCRRTVEACHECAFAKRHDERLMQWFRPSV